MRLEGVKISDLGADEVGSQHLARVLPVLSIASEDAGTKERCESGYASLS